MKLFKAGIYSILAKVNLRLAKSFGVNAGKWMKKLGSLYDVDTSRLEKNIFDLRNFKV